jgi:hypothetical protein
LVPRLERRPCDGGVESALKHLGFGIESSYLTNPIGFGFIGRLGDKADEFGVVDEYSVPLGKVLDSGVDVAHGSDVEVSNIHTDLGAAVGEDADGFDAVEASVGSADVSGDGAGCGYVGLLEVNVVGDEEAAGADCTGSGGFVEFGSADVWATRGVAANGIAEAFELTLTDVFEQDAIGAGGGGSVEVDGDTVTSPDEEAGLTRQDGAVCERRSADGDEWDDVGGSDARVHTVLPGQIDELCGLASGSDGGFDDAGGRAGDGDDRAVVRGIERPVEEANAFDLHSGYDLFNLGDVSAFREVGDAFDDGFWIHFASAVRCWWSLISLRVFYFHHV